MLAPSESVLKVQPVHLTLLPTGAALSLAAVPRHLGSPILKGTASLPLASQQPICKCSRKCCSLLMCSHGPRQRTDPCGWLPRKSRDPQGTSFLSSALPSAI